jgi:eukaryotic-like serine/threonine-protein kinase
MGNGAGLAAARAGQRGSAMTPEEWLKIKKVLQTALEIEPGGRRDFLDSACADQISVRCEVESLLLAHEEDQSFLEQPAAVEAADLLSHSAPAAIVGRRLGPYELLEEIGEGGMGAVYRALRADGMYEKQVAIKFIRGGMSSEFFISRFKNERQILAALEHPNIARLLDGGVTEKNLPYVVLEFVPGVPIDEYCERHKLSTTDRLKLFRTVCAAVQYAHQNLVVHRDLKPGNILVTADGIPKLLDFGIAKILDPQQEENGAERTLTVMRIMTPDFASPEQVRGDPVTTSSDVYSLGVILYVLLAGQRPYHITSTAPHEMIKAICDTDPEKPSTAATRSRKRDKITSADSAYAASGGAGHDHTREKLRRALTGDLDNIVLKALRKEPQRRYATVEQFSEDVRRHLENLPVIARSDTAGYRTSKFIMRHKAGVTATVAVALTLIAGLVITLQEARIAQRRFNDVRQLANSLIFDVHDSIQDLPGSTPARKIIVDRALQYLNVLAQESRGDLALQRELATAYERVGLVQGHYLQNSLGDTQGSLISYQKALQLRQQVAAKSPDGNDRLTLAAAHRLVANQQWALGDYAHAVENISTAVSTSEGLNGAHPRDANILKELGFEYELASQVQVNGYASGGGDPAKVEEYLRKALATDEAVLAISPDDTAVQYEHARDLINLGSTLGGQDRDLSAALECYEKALKIDQELRQRSPDTRYVRGVAVAYSHIGQTYDRLGDFARSLDNYRRGLEVSNQLVLVDAKNTWFRQGLAIAYANTANELSKMGPNAQSFGYVEKSDEIMRALVTSAPENEQSRGIFAALIATNGTTLMKLGKPEAAFKEFDEARSIYKSTGAALNAAGCIEKLGEAATRMGHAPMAGEYFQQALAVVEPLLSSQVVNLSALYTAADSYSGLGDLNLHQASRLPQNPANQRENWTRARACYIKSLEAWHRIDYPHRVAPNGLDAGDPAKVSKNLQICDAALASLP